MNISNINVHVENCDCSRMTLIVTAARSIRSNLGVNISRCALTLVNLENIGKVQITFCSMMSVSQYVLISLTNCSGTIDGVDISKALCNNGIKILSKSHVSIARSQFVTNGPENGMVYVADESVVLLDDCMFKNNDAGDGGAALFVTNSSVKIRNSIFDGNGRMLMLGGAIRMQNKATLYITSSVLNFNEAHSGGAIYMENLAQLEIHNSTFDSNVAAHRGGAICSTDLSNIKLSNVSFNHNLAGNIYTRTQSNKLKQHLKGEGPVGGAIYVDTINNLTCIICYFINNTADYQGGALWGISFKQIFIASSHFVQNRAESTHGGAVCLRNTEGNLKTDKLLLQNSSLKDNYAGSDGGALYLFGCHVGIKNSTFQGNVARSRGGALAAFNSILYIAEGIIHKNTVGQEDSTGCGGGLMAETNCTVYVTDSRFSANMAKNGPCAGVCAVDKIQMHLTRVDIVDNLAGTFGGAIDIESNSKVILSDCKISNNTSNLDSAIASVQDHSLFIARNCSFKRNTCSLEKTYGYNSCVNVEQSEVCFSRCNFHRNNATRDGGIIFTSKGKIRIANSSFLSEADDDEQDIFFWRDKSKTKFKMYTYFTTFRHQNRTLSSNEADFKNKAFKQRIFRSLDEAAAIQIEETPYASGTNLLIVQFEGGTAENSNFDYVKCGTCINLANTHVKSLTYCVIKFHQFHSYLPMIRLLI